jgi:hypothetical protein
MRYSPNILSLSAVLIVPAPRGIKARGLGKGAQAVGETSLFILAFLAARETIFCKFLVDNWLFGPEKRYSLLFSYVLLREER